MTDKKKGYKDTLNLPKTSFSMRANLPVKEPEMSAEWEKSDLYNKILERRKETGKSFILHDGPPYANGHIHLGHVLNKLLKDMCIKFFSMKGYRAPYVPGWDCHGLPVEHQLFKELKMTKHDIDQVKFRKKAHDYAMKYVKIQAEDFKRLGIFGDWDNPYLTLSKTYEADILFALADLWDNGFVYKDLKPVNWCGKCETALAEAEVEYEDKLSPSIYVKFLAEDKVDGCDTYFVIWTTTPWTLLANVAVALHPVFEYAQVKVKGEVWIMADDLTAGVMKKLGIEEFEILSKISGKELAGKIKKAKHPFLDRTSEIVLAEYVTKEEGTGCVHTAPGHGADDHMTGKKYNLPVIMPVDNSGKFTDEGGKYAGKYVLAANKEIIEDLSNSGALIMAEQIKHSYPHCWRCKEPIIFRATEQWFLKVDHNDLRAKILGIIENDVDWIPVESKERINSMIKQRPDWCLSRQRYWGVPIPAYRCKDCRTAFTSGALIRKVADLAKQEGVDVWFERPLGSFLPEGQKCAKCEGKEFEKENDILDVWFDSGVSHRAVLEEREELKFPCDLYLEGSDQHRGWFQTAMITSVATRGCAPYKKVLTHGFVVDGEGKKMSKSIGNVIRPEQILKKYGADILRLWVASSDYVDDIKISDEILDRLADGYRKIRNTFRFLLSNLFDFNSCEDAVDYEILSEINRWMLSRLFVLTDDVTRFYENWEFHKVYRAIYNFCVYEVSAVYLDVVKDILYVDGADSEKRKSSQTVIYNILGILVKLLAPVLSFTSEEVWREWQSEGKTESVHMSDWPDLNGEMAVWKDDALNKKWDKILELRDGVMKVLETKRGEGLIGSSLEAAIFVYSENSEIQKFLKENIDLFPMVFKVSQAEVREDGLQDFEEIPGYEFKIKVSRALGSKCERCWNFSKTVGLLDENLQLCERCHKIVLERSSDG